VLFGVIIIVGNCVLKTCFTCEIARGCVVQHEYTKLRPDFGVFSSRTSVTVFAHVYGVNLRPVFLSALYAGASSSQGIEA
jgi:hypothetical protein